PRIVESAVKVVLPPAHRRHRNILPQNFANSINTSVIEMGCSWHVRQYVVARGTSWNKIRNFWRFPVEDLCQPFVRVVDRMNIPNKLHLKHIESPRISKHREARSVSPAVTLCDWKALYIGKFTSEKRLTQVLKSFGI